MYTFRARIDKRGSNIDRFPRHRMDAFLWDVNRKDGRNILRIVRRWRTRPFVAVFVGNRYRHLRVGFREDRYL